MAAEKRITSLSDLQEAAKLAAADGSCTIRLAGGESLVLVQPKQPAVPERHDVTDPAEEQVVLSCLEPGGKYYSSADALLEVKRRLAARRG